MILGFSLKFYFFNSYFNLYTLLFVSSAPCLIGMQSLDIRINIKNKYTFQAIGAALNYTKFAILCMRLQCFPLEWYYFYF